MRKECKLLDLLVNHLGVECPGVEPRLRRHSMRKECKSLDLLRAWIVLQMVSCCTAMTFLLSSKAWGGANTGPVQDTVLEFGKIRTDYLTITSIQHVLVCMLPYVRCELCFDGFCSCINPMQNVFPWKRTAFNWKEWEISKPHCMQTI
jgi:hypothetical protein